MLKLIFWGLIGYAIYKFFKMKERLKEGQQNEAAKFSQQNQGQGAPAEKIKSEGEFIDYEELK